MKVNLISQPQQAAFRIEQAIKNQASMPASDKEFCGRVLATVREAKAASGTHSIKIGSASQSAVESMIAALKEASVPANVVNAEGGDDLQVLF